MLNELEKLHLRLRSAGRFPEPAQRRSAYGARSCANVRGQARGGAGRRLRRLCFAVIRCRRKPRRVCPGPCTVRQKRLCFPACAKGGARPGARGMPQKRTRDPRRSLAPARPEAVRKHIAYTGFLPRWTVSETDFSKAYADRMDNLASQGYGVFSKFHMFTAERRRDHARYVSPTPCSLPT